MKVRTAAEAERLTDIPDIGPAMANDFAQLGIAAPAQPFGVDASALPWWHDTDERKRHLASL